MWVYYLLIHVIKNCDLHCYGFQNLISSWGWGNTILKTIFTWVFKYLVPKIAIVFTDINDKRKVWTIFRKFKNMICSLKLNLKFALKHTYTMYFENHIYTQAPTVSLRGPRQIYTRGPKRRVWWDGLDGISKVSFNFFHTLWVYRWGIYLPIHVIKNCRQ